MKEVKCLKKFAFGGKQREKGERLKMSNNHARLLTILGKVSELPGDDKDKGREREREREPQVTRPMVAQPLQAGTRGRGGNRSGQYMRADVRPEERRAVVDDTATLNKEDEKGSDNEGGTEK